MAIRRDDLRKTDFSDVSSGKRLAPVHPGDVSKTRGSDISSLRSVVRQATKVSGFIDWRDVGDYANRLGDLAQILDERIGDGNPNLVELIEDAIAQAEDSLGQIDDSNGEVMPVIVQLREVHERATRVDLTCAVRRL